jgi:hypothetical protein
LHSTQSNSFEKIGQNSELTPSIITNTGLLGNSVFKYCSKDSTPTRKASSLRFSIPLKPKFPARFEKISLPELQMIDTVKLDLYRVK